MSNINVQICILNPQITMPEKATQGSAGLDLRAAIEQPQTIADGKTVLIPSGIAVHLANPAYAAILLPRSGLGHKHGIVLGNLVGLIDSDYQGEIKVSIWNRSSKAYTVEPLERIAQMIIVPIAHANFNVVDNFVESSRATEGFGSTGQN